MNNIMYRYILIIFIITTTLYKSFVPKRKIRKKALQNPSRFFDKIC